MKSTCYAEAQGRMKIQSCYPDTHVILNLFQEIKRCLFRRSRNAFWMTGRIVIMAIITGFLSVPEMAFAISPQQLQEMMGNGEQVTIIDIRALDVYRDGHIPGAISMPVTIISKKRLPALGSVIVYGDGIRADLTLDAVNTLNTMTGIQADMLEGGFSAWESLNLPTTQAGGFREERLAYLAYGELEKVAAASPDAVLVDMRSRPEQGGTDSALTDLSAVLPGLNIIRLNRKPRTEGREWDISAITRRGSDDTRYRWLYILIDDGDGEAENVVRSLKAAGIRRAAILTGGEQILRRGGSPGSGESVKPVTR